MTNLTPTRTFKSQWSRKIDLTRQHESMGRRQRSLLHALIMLGIQGFVTSLSASAPSPADGAAFPNPLPVDTPLDSQYQSHYAMYWENILLSEFQHTSRELQEQRRQWSRQRLEESGISVFGAIAEPDSELFGEKVVRIVKPHAPMAFQDKFTRGDVLLITPHVPNIDPIPRECLVMDVGRDWMSLGVGPAWLPGLWESRKQVGFYQVRLDRTAPQAPLRAQRRALRLLEQDKAGGGANFLARTFCNSTDAEAWASRASTNPSMEQDIVAALEKAKEKTTRGFVPNPSQEAAIRWALQRRLSLIRGPAGTGKTRLAAMLISTALMLSSDASTCTPTRVLAVTHSNGAADVLLEALLDMGVPAVRLGRPASVSPKVQHRTVVAMAEKLPRMVELRRIMGDGNMDDQSRASAAFDLRQELVAMQDIITHAAPVVVTSCIGAHQLLLQEEDGNENSLSQNRFSMLVLDEAAQTTEPALICALAAAKAEQVVMVGDTRQLPPTITLMDLRDTLGVSPMARLEQAGIGLFTLQTQYRMPPSLLEHPSHYFYKGAVGCAEEIKELPPPKGFPWPSSLPLAFINIGGGGAEVAHNFGGRSNPSEVELLTELVWKVLDANEIDASGIAIISPYAKQVQRIRMELANRHGRHPKANLVRVGTVDSFQGQETDLVLISTVRSNPLQELGFLRDPRRLCVAITRARRGLIIVGDRSVLQSCRHWAALLQSCDDRQCSMDAPQLEPRRDPLEMPVLSTKEFNMMDLFDDMDDFDGLFTSIPADERSRGQ